MGFRSAWLLLPLLLAGCGNREVLPFVGKWNGRFRVEDGPGTVRDRERRSLVGFLQVYATGRTYKMELRGEQQTVAISGTWKVQGDRLTLTARDVSVDDMGGEQKRNPNLAFLDSQDVEATYSKPLTLALSPNRNSLQGLLTSIGPWVGTHRFERDFQRVR